MAPVCNSLMVCEMACQWGLIVCIWFHCFGCRQAQTAAAAAPCCCHCPCMYIGSWVLCSPAVSKAPVLAAVAEQQRAQCDRHGMGAC